MFFPDAAKILDAQLLQPAPVPLEGASIDTRTLQPGNLFVALPGAQADGHQFLAAAFDKKASGAIVTRQGLQSLKNLPASWQNLLVTEDPAAAFLKLSAAYRKTLPLKKALAVVGSVGKTSTKEFLHYLFSQKSSALATQGNLNNHLGLPITLFRLRPDHEYAICELGTNHLGEIRLLAEALRPEAGVLTKIAAEHLEGFGSLDNVYEGEIELFHAMKPGAVAVIPDDDAILDAKIKNLPLTFIRVGFSEKADYRVTGVKSENGWVTFQLNGIPFSFPGVAAFLSRNAAMALALADRCGFSLKEMPAKWSNLKLPSGRFEIQTLRDGVHAIFDGYNASPASFEAALKTFEEMRVTGRKILVFSDMLELGSDERKYHEELGRQIASSKPDAVMAYGKRSAWSIEALKKQNAAITSEWVADAKTAASRLASTLEPGDWLLLKASRSMKIEEVLNHLSGKEPAIH